MKVTKYTHSCLLVETPDRVALIDPGGFSWKSDSLDLDSIERIDRILVTHSHGDHMSVEFIEAVTKKFPEVHIVANEEVVQALQEAGVKGTYRGLDTACSRSFEAPHEPIEPFSKTAMNNGYHFQGELSHPGDSHSFNESKRILAMPFVAPWGIVMDGIKKCQELKPEIVIPIHDWFFSEPAKEWLYGRIKEVLAKDDIKLEVLSDGESVEL